VRGASRTGRRGAQYRHVNWPSPTLPLVTVAFRAPAFSDTKKDQAALSMLLSLSFGRTSPLYKRLVQDEQKVDQLFDYTPNRVDPSLVTIAARVKKPADALYVRNAILETVARCATRRSRSRLLKTRSRPKNTA
jgi:zinc protease